MRDQKKTASEPAAGEGTKGMQSYDICCVAE